MSKRLILVGVIAGVFGVAAGYLVGLRSNMTLRDRSEVYVTTAVHTKTYVSIAHLLRKGNHQAALKLADAMIDAGDSWLSPVPRELDADDKAHLANVLSAVRQYRGMTRDWQMATRTTARISD